ncbi:Predicted protein [Aquimarina amphilecti]|uniref:Flagellin biosynthesis protein FlgD n=1 Tax=Aquimarina amphilecti TaxID=1038014 RepID=A0A1H7PL87_AQUAM|nr:DUF2271 domain-containing protein [Aquimarina amphilecti]SEL36560.1 Predicted protein [Aquimarina amphilecti]
MKTIFRIVLLTVSAVFTLVSFTSEPNTTSLKCMIQMVNYTGEGAYVVISLIKPEGEYNQTLYVQGKDSEWYSDITEWWKFYGKRRLDIDAISGATIAGGERTVSIIKIPKDRIDAGYKIRFETAVEDQEYYKKDVEFELTSETLASKVKGKGFIRYVRMLPQ